MLSQPFYSLESAIASINLFHLFPLALKLNRSSNEFTQSWIIKKYSSLFACISLAKHGSLNGKVDGPKASSLEIDW